MLTYPTEDIWSNKEASNTTEEVEEYFPGLLSFTDSTEQQIQSRPVDKDRRKSIFLRKKRHTVKNRLWLTIVDIFYKANKERKKHDYDL